MGQRRGPGLHAGLGLVVGANCRGLRGAHLVQKVGCVAGSRLVLALGMPHQVLQVAQALEHERVLGVGLRQCLGHLVQFLTQPNQI